MIGTIARTVVILVPEHSLERQRAIKEWTGALEDRGCAIHVGLYHALYQYERQRTRAWSYLVDTVNVACDADCQARAHATVRILRSLLHSTAFPIVVLTDSRTEFQGYDGGCVAVHDHYLPMEEYYDFLAGSTCRDDMPMLV